MTAVAARASIVRRKRSTKSIRKSLKFSDLNIPRKFPYLWRSLSVYLYFIQLHLTIDCIQSMCQSIAPRNRFLRYSDHVHRFHLFDFASWFEIKSTFWVSVVFLQNRFIHVAIIAAYKCWLFYYLLVTVSPFIVYSYNLYPAQLQIHTHHYILNLQSRAYFLIQWVFNKIYSYKRDSSRRDVKWSHDGHKSTFLAVFNINSSHLWVASTPTQWVVSEEEEEEGKQIFIFKFVRKIYVCDTNLVCDEWFSMSFKQNGVCELLEQ